MTITESIMTGGVRTNVSVTEFIYADHGDGTWTTTRKEKIDPVNAGDETYLATTTTTESDENDRPLSIVYADGRKDAYVYEIGDYDETYPVPPSTFTLNSDGGYERVTITHGSNDEYNPDSVIPVAGLSTRHVLIDVFGNVTAVTTYLDDPALSDPIIREVTDFHATDNDAMRVTYNGLLVSATDKAQLTTAFEYDGSRREKVTNARGIWAQTYYDDVGRVSSVETPIDDTSTATTAYEYCASDSPHEGRLKSVANTLGNYTYYVYNERGRITNVWGDVPQPVGIEYDSLGQRTTLKTCRAGTGWDGTSWPEGQTGDPDETVWAYDPATGLLTSKTYADQTTVAYGYTLDGKPETRTWARQLGSGAFATTYHYYDYGHDPDNVTGELRQIEYPVGSETTNVEFTYDRLGQLASVVDAAGTRTFDYGENDIWRTETFDSSPMFGDMQIEQGYDDLLFYADGFAMLEAHFRRLASIKVGTAVDPDADYEATYDYDPDTGRMTRVLGPGLPDGGALYTYLADSHLLWKTRYEDGGAYTARTIRTFEDYRDLLASVKNKWTNATIVSLYTYANDDLGRRDDLSFSSDLAELPDYTVDWGYNARNELTSAARVEDQDADT